MSLSPRLMGIGLAVLGVLLLSPDAALVRLFDGDHWTMVFYRTAGVAVVLGGMSVAFYGRKLPAFFKDMHWTGWLAIVMAGYGPALWTMAVALAGGSTVLALLAIAPLVASIGGWIVIGERLQLATILCSIMALVGVLWTVWDGLNTTEISLLGLALAVFLPINHAMMFVFMRKINRPNAWPIMAVGSLLMMPIAFVLAPTIALTTSAQLWSVVPTVTIVATLSFALMIVAMRYVPASDVILINMLEPVVGVLFLWWLVKELPTANQWIGGGIVLVAVSIFAVWQIWDERRKLATEAG